MKKILLKSPTIVNEGNIFEADVLVENERIVKIEPAGIAAMTGMTIVDASGKYLLPGVIDDQVHFREPGLTHKGDIYSESKAAVAGGVTSYMDMPNTIPQAITHPLLEEKYRLASQTSLANFSFFLGATNDNTDEVKKTDPGNVCGVKVFMGSSTGSMLVDNEKTLETIFSNSPVLVATHCEDEATIRRNIEVFRATYGDDVPVKFHPVIRSTEACFLSSNLAVGLARRFDTRLHILHVSSAKELELFDNTLPLSQKKITAEVCIHHLWFDDADYARLGNLIKWNPAVKTLHDKNALLQGLLDDRLDIIATDHAPHTMEEKKQLYFKAPSGGPLIQHTLVAVLELFHRKKITLEKVVEKMCHAPAVCYRIKERGFIREGYYADLVLVDLHDAWTVNKSNILYKCGWSPFEGEQFHARVTHTFVNGHPVFANGFFNETLSGKRLLFER